MHCVFSFQAHFQEFPSLRITNYVLSCFIFLRLGNSRLITLKAGVALEHCIFFFFLTKLNIVLFFLKCQFPAWRKTAWLAGRRFNTDTESKLMKRKKEEEKELIPSLCITTDSFALSGGLCVFVTVSLDPSYVGEREIKSWFGTFRCI